MKNGPNTVGSVAPGGVRSPSPTVSIDRPRTSASRTNSCRVAPELCPVRVRKSIPAKYSCSVSPTSRANACRCRTSAVITSLNRGSADPAKLATTWSVRSSIRDLLRRSAAFPGIVEQRPQCVAVERDRVVRQRHRVRDLTGLLLGQPEVLQPTRLEHVVQTLWPADGL